MILAFDYIFQNLLREAGCLKKLIRLLRTHEMALRVGQSVTYPAVVTRVVNTVTNLAVNEENQKQLQVRTMWQGAFVRLLILEID